MLGPWQVAPTFSSAQPGKDWRLPKSIQFTSAIETLPRSSISLSIKSASYVIGKIIRMKEWPRRSRGKWKLQSISNWILSSRLLVVVVGVSVVVIGLPHSHFVSLSLSTDVNLIHCKRRSRDEEEGARNENRNERGRKWIELDRYKNETIWKQFLLLLLLPSKLYSKI